MFKTKYKGKFAIRIYRGKRDDADTLDYYRIETYLNCPMELYTILGICQFLAFIPVQHADDYFWIDEFDIGEFNARHNRSWYNVKVEEYMHSTIMEKNGAFLCVKNKFAREEDVLAEHEDECQYDTGSFWRYVLAHDNHTYNGYTNTFLTEYSSTPVINMKFSKRITMRKLILNRLGENTLSELSDVIIIFDNVNFKKYFKTELRKEL